jgi:hypothetical protein
MVSIRVIVADGHPTVCQGLEDLLSAADDTQVVGVCGDGDEALRLVFFGVYLPCKLQARGVSGWRELRGR